MNNDNLAKFAARQQAKFEERVWLPANLHRYEKQIAEHNAYLDLKIDGLNKDLEHIAGGVLDDRDAAADLRDRLKRELASTALQS